MTQMTDNLVNDLNMINSRFLKVTKKKKIYFEIQFNKSFLFVSLTKKMQSHAEALKINKLKHKFNAFYFIFE